MSTRIITALISVILSLGVAGILAGQGGATPSEVKKPAAPVCDECTMSNSVTITLILRKEWVDDHPGYRPIVSVRMRLPKGYAKEYTEVARATYVRRSFHKRDGRTYQLKYTAQRLPADTRLEVLVVGQDVWEFDGDDTFTIHRFTSGGRTFPGHASVRLYQYFDPAE